MVRRKWFTLIELVIVIVIIGILSVILLRTYTWISQMTFRVQQTKNVHQEVLHLSQVFQAYADRNSVDFTQYQMKYLSSKAKTWTIDLPTKDLNVSSLDQTQGMTSVLYLAWEDGSLAFYMTGDCSSPSLSGHLVLTGKCRVEMIQSGTTIPLTDSNRVNIRNLVFKIIPFAPSDDYLQNDAPCPNNDYLHCVHTPGFWVVLDAYGINYGTQWTNRVHIPLQLFY